MKNFKVNASNPNLKHKITAEWLRRTWDERTTNQVCLHCEAPLHEWDTEGEEIACIDCRDNKYSSGGG